MPTTTGVADLVEIEVPAGGRVVVASDLHLGKDATTVSAATAAELSRVISDWRGPGVVVLAGDFLELLASDANNPKRALAAHPRLASALTSFSRGHDHRLVCLPGNHDARLAWDEAMAADLTRLTGAEIALAAELRVATGAGERRVLIEHGHQLDPPNALADPRDPSETPIGYHLAHDVLPGMGAARDGWLEGVEALADPVDFPTFVASRLAYRKIARHLRWLLVPFALALLLKVPLLYRLLADLGRRPDPGTLSRTVAMICAAVAGDILLVASGVVMVTRRAWRATSGALVGSRGQAQNDAARSRAGRLAAEGITGYITGHTHHAELTVTGDAFYANTGSGTSMVEARPRRLGLPPVFLPHRQLSWVEMEAGADLHVRLHHARADMPGGTRLERLLGGKPAYGSPKPAVVASFPSGPSWPVPADRGPRDRRVRRTASAAIAAAGFLDLVSAFTPPLRGRLRLLLDIVPLAVPQVAAALVAVAGLGLVLVARGVRRGQRRAWSISIGLLAGAAGLHLVKGVDLEESVVAAVVGLYLLRHRSAFRARSEPASLRRGVVALLSGAAGAVVLGTIVAEIGSGRHPSGWGDAALAVAERLAGITSMALPGGRVDQFLTPALVAVGLGLGLLAGWLAFRPVLAGRHPRQSGDLADARDIVRRHGSGTLAYFALRDDKRHFFCGESVVAYGVYNGVCLVSPDPVGPQAERDRVWTEFRQFADRQSWTVAVIGAGEEWLPVYRRSGMQDLYVGDEAVVDCQRFSLDGGRSKGLRQAVNRVARNGYLVEFHDPAEISLELQEDLLAVMAKSRRGDVERGFSMTLGRVFEPADTGLLLAVCVGPEGKPVAFCQYVPAPGIGGYSLDLMRRDAGEHPNGITDFVVVETIRHLREKGCRGLGLNFATMRAVLSGEAGDGLAHRAQRWLLLHLSDSMQIESLWRFTAKYDPDWRPCYAVYDGAENMMAAAMAVARAESFWELPVIGRFLTPSTASTQLEVDGVDAGEGLAEAGLARHRR